MQRDNHEVDHKKLVLLSLSHSKDFEKTDILFCDQTNSKNNLYDPSRLTGDAHRDRIQDRKHSNINKCSRQFRSQISRRLRASTRWQRISRMAPSAVATTGARPPCRARRLVQTPARNLQPCLHRLEKQSCSFDPRATPVSKIWLNLANATLSRLVCGPRQDADRTGRVGRSRNAGT